MGHWLHGVAEPQTTSASCHMHTLLSWTLIHAVLVKVKDFTSTACNIVNDTQYSL